MSSDIGGFGEFGEKLCKHRLCFASGLALGSGQVGNNNNVVSYLFSYCFLVRSEYSMQLLVFVYVTNSLDLLILCKLCAHARNYFRLARSLFTFCSMPVNVLDIEFIGVNN